jgi:regulator of sigma E protease
MTATVIVTVLITFIAAFFLFSLTVFVHELGHFLAARWQGLVVEEFAIGMGKKLWGFRWRGVDYNLRVFPFGGFVKLPQMVAMEMVEGDSKQDIQSLPVASPWAKIITAFAGPLFSFLLAVAFAFICYAVGKPDNKSLLTRTIGYVEPGSPAEREGLLPGDMIVRINGKSVSRWDGRYDAIVPSILLGTSERVQIEVQRGSEGKTFSILPVKDPEFENLPTIGIEKYPSRKAVVDKVIPNSPASMAGIEVGSTILSLNGETISSPGQVVYLVGQSEGPIRLLILHKEVRQEVVVEPKVGSNGKKMMGIAFQMRDAYIVHVPPFEQITDGILTIKRTFEALVSPKSGVGFRHLSGPVGIFDKLMNLLTVDWRLVLYFSVILNVNLAIMNLMPIPILDGGHIVLSLAEWIRKRPADPKFIEILHMASFGLILCFFLYVTYFDLGRSARNVKNFFESTKTVPAPEPSFEAPAVQPK